MTGETSETEGLSSKVNKYIGLQMHSKSYLTLWYMIRTTKTFTHCSRVTKKAANNVLTGISFVRKSKTFKLINHVPRRVIYKLFEHSPNIPSELSRW